MALKLVKSERIEIKGLSYQVRYYERRTASGAARFSGEVLLGTTDRIILDDDSIASLESRIVRVVPATLLTHSMLNADPSAGSG
jgi:hypothetical protein